MRSHDIRKNGCLKCSCFVLKKFYRPRQEDQEHQTDAACMTEESTNRNTQQSDEVHGSYRYMI